MSRAGLRRKQAALADCHRLSPPAVIGVTRFGLRNGYACFRSCWAMMFAAGIAGPWSVLWMIAITAITAITAIEKRARRPRHTARMVALILAGGAVLAAATGT